MAADPSPRSQPESLRAETPWGPRAFSLVDPDGFAFTILSSG